MGKEKEGTMPIKDMSLDECIQLLKQEGKAFKQQSHMEKRLKQIGLETGDSRVKVYQCFLNMLKYGYSGSAEQKYESGMLALHQAQQANDPYVIQEAYRVLANMASVSGDWNLAIDYCWNALEGIEELTYENAAIFQEVNVDLAVIFDRMDDIRNVAHYTQRALKSLNKYKFKGDFSRRLLIYYNLAYSYQNMESYDLFEKYLNKCKKILNEHPEISRLRYAFLVESCVLAIHRERIEEADAYLQEVLKFDFKGQFWDILFTLSDLLLSRGEYHTCKIILDYLKPLVLERNELVLKMFFLENEIAYFRAIGDKEGYSERCVAYYHLTMQEREENRKATLRSLDFTIKINNKEVLLRGLKQEQVLLTRKLEQDELTGLSSRYYAKEYGNAMIAKARRENRAVTVEIMDVDCFKQYNDTYGHLDGDTCLRKIAEVIKNTLKEDDIGIRFGGDEFLIIRLDCDQQLAKKIAEDIEKQVRELAIPHVASPNTGCITVSQGIIASIPETKQNLREFINLADQALYKVKNAGKNGIYIHTL